MIISPGRGFIFVHIPKTGGTSVALALEARAMKDDILIGDTPKARRRKRRLDGYRTSGRIWKHSRLSDIYGLVDQSDIEQMFVFTLVRNPWDRLVSYYHWLKEQTFDHPAVALAGSVDFSSFVNDPQTIASLSASPYRSYTRDRFGNDRCDLFIPLEDVDQALPELQARIGVKLGGLARANRSQRAADFRTYYSDADRETVARICAEDIERFGYTFE